MGVSPCEFLETSNHRVRALPRAGGKFVCGLGPCGAHARGGLARFGAGGFAEGTDRVLDSGHIVLQLMELNRQVFAGGTGRTGNVVFGALKFLGKASG